MKAHEIEIKRQKLFLDPLKAIYWEEKSTLIFSDLHFGKAAHFRKNGIPIPFNIHERDLKNINHLFNVYSPKKIIIVGDLFHSVWNSEWNSFESFLENHHDTEFILVKGNHDILDEGSYKTYIKCVDNYESGPFFFSHQPCEGIHELYNISGHIHPSITISGRAKQSVKFECFYFSENFAVLPSFGNFTGNYKISAKFGDKIYLIVNEQVIVFKPSIYSN